jgi:hypothetical protein
VEGRRLAKRDPAGLVLRSFAMARRNHGLRIARDFIRFAMENKKWWLVPMIAVTLGLVLVVFLSATPLAPFIYTIF